MVDVNIRPEGWNKELYDKLSFEYLIECAKNHRIDEWNQAYEEYLKSEWERLFPDERYDSGNKGKLFAYHYGFVRPDYSKKDFKKAISDGANFSRVHLEGADFHHAHLDGAIFIDAHLEEADFHDAHFKGAYFHHAHLDGVIFIDAYLEGADFSNSDANFKKAYFHNAHLEKAVFNNVRLAETEFIHTYLEEAKFRDTHLDGAAFFSARLEGANFSKASLKGAEFVDTRLEGANFNTAHIEGSYFNYAILNGETLFTNNTIDNKTDFTGASLSSARIDPDIRTKLERNIRQTFWEKWYAKPKLYPDLGKIKNTLIVKFSHNTSPEKKDWETKPCWVDRIINAFVRLFWLISNYGSSTKRIIAVFFGWNLIWAFIYFCLLPYVPGTSTTVLNVSNFGAAILQTNLMMFSITDLATEGLDILPMLCVTIHIVIGYFILAALITRLGIMFQNLSP